MSSGGRLPYLDGWRGIAIFMVLLAHFAHIGEPDLGRFGVDLFFVLSGLLMGRILFQQRMPIGLFYRRRVSRILPVFLAFVVFAWVGWSHLGARYAELLTTLTFTRTYLTHPTIWHSVLPDGNLWSLNVEEQAYVILATIAAFAVLRKRAALILLALGAGTVVAIKAHLHFQADGGRLPFLLTTECAAGGLFLSAAYRQICHRVKVPGFAPLLALFGAFACYWHVGPWYLSVTAAPVLLAFSVNHIGESYRWIVRALEWRPLCVLGVLSYSIYLWQQPFYKEARYFPLHSGVLFAIAAGALSFYVLEKPTRRWLNAHWRPSLSTGHASVALEPARQE